MADQAPTIDDFSADSGTRGDGITDANVVTLWGKAGANTTITVYDGTTRLGTATTNASGSWSFTTPKLADSAHSLTATATDGSGTSSASQTMSIKVMPSVTQLVPGTDNWSNPTVIDGQGWYNENAGKSWSLTAPDSHTVRMEVRAGDYWADGGNSSRSEILAANSVANGQTFNASYSMTVEPGTSNVGSGLSWLSLTQMYGADGATFSIQLKGEQMAVVVNLNEPTEKQVYLDSSAIQRGHAYNIQIQAHFASDSSGYLDIWRDGIQIVDYHGILGDPGANYNLKLGIYRGDPSAANYTMAADYSNIVTSTDPAFPTPPFGGASSQAPTPPTVPTSPVIKSFSTDSGAAGDGVTNDNTLILSGTASAGNTIKVYDGTTLLGSATANSGGTWSFATSALADGKHSFSASAGSSNGTSAQSPSLAVVVDTVAPSAPSISSSTPTAGKSSALMLKGSAEANSKVSVYDGKTLLGSAATNGSGAWSFTTAALSTGAHQLTASSTDSAGNSSKASSAFNVDIKGSSSAPTVSSVSASGSGIVSGNGNLDAGKTVTLAVKFSDAVTVAGGTPKLELNDGGAAAYVGGSGTNTLTFKYTVAAGQNTSDLAITAVNLGTSTVKDSAGDLADLSGAVSNPAGTLHIDTSKPSVISATASGRGITAGSGNLGVGRVVNLTLKLSEAITVAGGTPTLKLNDGGTASYVSGSGTDTLTFRHTVAAGQNTPDLAITAVSSGTATVRDSAGNIANLSGAVSSLAGTLQVHTTQSVNTAQIPATASDGSQQGGLPHFGDHQWLGSPALLSDASNAALGSTRGASQLSIAPDASTATSAADVASTTDQRLALFAQYIAASSAPQLAEFNASPINSTAWSGTEQHFAQPIANQQHAPMTRST